MKRRPMNPNFPEVFGLDHAAYRCRDAQETRDFYEGLLGFPLEVAMYNEKHPTTGEELYYMHLFFDIGSPDPKSNSYIAFFDVLGEAGNDFDFKKQWGMDLHFAMKVNDVDAINAWRDRFKELGVQFDGPVDHGVCTSLYFHDPNGYRLEFMAMNAENAAEWEEHKQNAHSALEDWNRIKAKAQAQPQTASSI